ncbi:class I SAM-dependent methyltransferase [Actinopolymorpha sp. B17G11]|uniref:class I SAM-dependent methyltransferase n=1 Tax=Actinopolymorpha sp. B17G11 TaxID=3160861 RepID=UPI0032E52BB1
MTSKARSHAGQGQRRPSTALAAEQADILSAHLPAPPARVLDAGCGNGDLALALTGKGYDVTGVDVDPQAVRSAAGGGVRAVTADIAEYASDQPFDAVVFSLSLHHVARLDDAVARARDLLVPGGHLVLDEFAWERADRPTAGWFYDMAAILEAANVLAHADDTSLAADPLRHWQYRHHDREPMHPGTALTAAVTRRFGTCDTFEVAYLYRYLGGWVQDDETGLRIVRTLRDIEEREIINGGFAPVGLRVVARRPGPPR